MKPVMLILLLSLCGCDYLRARAVASSAADAEFGAIHGLPIEPFNSEIANACAVGCAEPVSDYSPGDVVDQPDAKVGDLVRCPVSGVVFRVQDESPAVEWQTKQYYTCCGGCAAELNTEVQRAGG